MENTKRDLSLDFTKPRIPRGGGQPAPCLVTPILNLSTPEINKMISEEDELTVLTPNAISSVIPQTNTLPSPLIPTTVNNSNNIINNSSNNNCNGNNIHHHNHHDNGVSSTHQTRNVNGKKTSSSNIDSKHNIRQDVDLEKIEKKRERNRLAAKKCRQRKLETIDELRKEVMQWEQKYQKLEMIIDALRKENDELRSHSRGQ